MLAFVLGGGGTKGAAQAGAIRAMLERGIVPDMLVGTSAGAINAAHLAARPTVEGAFDLEENWRQITSEILFGSGRRTAAWRTVRGRPSLYSSDDLRAFLQARTPEIRRFAALDIELYIVASDLRTGGAYVFGDDPREYVLDAVMASTAVPPVYPPILHDGRWLVDGGVSSNMPLRIAIQRGATEIYAVNISNQPPEIPENMRVWTVSELSISAMVRHQIQEELAWARLQPGVQVHYLRVPFTSAASMWDTDHIEDFLALGHASANLFLIRRGLPQPERSPLRAVWSALGAVRRGANAVVRGIAFAARFVARTSARRRQADLVEDAPIRRDSADVDVL